MPPHLPLALTALLLAALPAAAQSVPADPAAGGALAERWCAGCHVVSPGQQAGADFGPTFAQLAADPGKTATRLKSFLQEPHKPMPPVELSRRQIDDLIAYIGSLKGKQ